VQGVPQNVLETELQMSGEDMLQMTNQLLSQNLIDVLSGGSGKDLIFKLKDLDQAMKYGACHSAVTSRMLKQTIGCLFAMSPRRLSALGTTPS